MMFATDYLEARTAFCQAAHGLQAQVRRIDMEAGGARAADGSRFSLDVATIGSGPRCLVLSSGLHGVEGYAGSAVQRWLMQRQLPSDLRVVLLHSLNPVGMATFRRANENNVDLNRNFLAADEAYNGSPSHYARLDGLLNPTRAVGGLEFGLRTGWQILRHGYGPLKQAIAGGQYDYPQGLFWGGDCLQEGPALVLEALPAWFEGAESVTWVDLHTGLGPRGGATHLVDGHKGSPTHARLVARFGERVEGWDQEGGVAYAIRGGFPGAIMKLLGPRVDVLTCEFGTLPAIQILRRLITDNRIHQQGGDLAQAQAAMRSAFYPDDAEWQRRVEATAAVLIDRCLARL